MTAVSKIKQTSRSITVPTKAGNLSADLYLPENATGLIVFAHGSGSSRRSPSCKYIASELNKMHFGTMLLDLLTKDEDKSGSLNEPMRFDISVLTDRLVEVLDWLATDSPTHGMKLAIFGTSTGAVSAIDAAARRANLVNAVVSKSGRPDLASKSFSDLSVPTLLIVGGKDRLLLSQNRKAFEQMNCVKKLSVIVGTNHLFKEPGTLEQVAHEAGQWFHRHLVGFEY